MDFESIESNTYNLKYSKALAVDILFRDKSRENMAFKNRYFITPVTSFDGKKEYISVFSKFVEDTVELNQKLNGDYD